MNSNIITINDSPDSIENTNQNEVLYLRLRLNNEETTMILKKIDKILKHLLVDNEQYDLLTEYENKIRKLLNEIEIGEFDEGVKITLILNGYRRSVGDSTKGEIIINLNKNEIKTNSIIEAIVSDLKNKMGSLSQILGDIVYNFIDLFLNVIQCGWNLFCRFMLILGDNATKLIDLLLERSNDFLKFLKENLHIDDSIEINGKNIMILIRTLLKIMETKLTSLQFYESVIKEIYDKFLSKIIDSSENIRLLIETFFDLIQTIFNKGIDSILNWEQ